MAKLGQTLLMRHKIELKKKQEDHSCQHFWSANSQNVPLEVGFWGFYRM